MAVLYSELLHLLIISSVVPASLISLRSQSAPAVLMSVSPSKLDAISVHAESRHICVSNSMALLRSYLVLYLVLYLDEIGSWNSFNPKCNRFNASFGMFGWCFCPLFCWNTKAGRNAVDLNGMGQQVLLFWYKIFHVISGAQSELLELTLALNLLKFF